MKTRTFLLLTILLSATLMGCATDPTYSQPAAYGYNRGSYPLFPDSAWIIHDLTRQEAYRLARERGLIR